MAVNLIEGGAYTPKGFLVGGVNAGILKNSNARDLFLIYSKKPANSAAVYTDNKIKGAPLLVTKDNLANGRAQAIICNIGNANACNSDGIEVAKGTCSLLAKELKIAKSNIIVASAGAIGQPMPMDTISKSIPSLIESLSNEGSSGSTDIMTADERIKEVAVSFEIGGKPCYIGGVAVSSGAAHSNMATMLVFITTDCDISTEMLSLALSGETKNAFSLISINSDVSTNDLIAIMANGIAKNSPIIKKGRDYAKFTSALNVLITNLSRKIVADSDGATKLIECSVVGAKNDACAKTIAKSVISSSLVKTAMFGALPDWGRIIAAIGGCGAEVDVSKVDISFVSGKGEIPVCYGGVGINFSEDFAKEILSEEEVTIAIKLGDGNGSAVALGCDLSYDYVKINSGV